MYDKITPPPKGRIQGPVTKNWILNPYRKSKTGEAREFKFLVRIDMGKSHLTNDKVPLKGVWSGSMVEFLNFKTPYLNLRWVKLEASNLVYE